MLPTHLSNLDLVTTVRAHGDTFINLLVNNASVGASHHSFGDDNTPPEEISRDLFSSELQAWNEVLHLNTSSMFFTSGRRSTVPHSPLSSSHEHT